MRHSAYAKWLKLWIGLILAVSLVLSVKAQEVGSSQSEISAQLEKLQAEIQRLQAALEELKQKQQALANGHLRPPAASQTASTAAPASDSPASAATQPRPSEPEKKEPPATKLPEWLGRTTFSGTAYLRFSRELQAGTKGMNEFELDRIYFILRSQLTEQVSLRFTMEGARRDAAGDFDVATKHFFVEVAKFPFNSSRFVAGLADLPWVPYEEGLWGYRFQGTVFPDREGYLTSTDLGAGWKVDLPQKWGDFHFSLVNGEGWTRPEAGKHKDVHLRVTLMPIRFGWGRNIFIGAFGSAGQYDGMDAGEPRDRQRVLIQSGYRGRYLRLMGSYLWAHDPASQLLKRHPSLAARVGEMAHGQGYSLWTVLNLGYFSEPAEKWELLARYDQLDPDRSITNNEHHRWILGGSYRWNRYVQTLFDYERVRVDLGSLRPFERRIMVQNEIRF